MGCTPSKSNITYSHVRVSRDLDTCSTFVPSVKSSGSTPERPSPQLSVETSSGKQTFLSVPTRDCYGRSVSQSTSPDGWSTASTGSPLGSVRPCLQSNCADSDSEDDCTAPSIKR
ncbi:hypothetical protein E1301_Tti008441 [Triplophysa tibetana]|uniref:Uncharacterized protein n=1 Tax=Triplophysa tibetana TaxID=1572043 RepID=A0A5A9P0L0_9TELE|nr:hypothetical protein E1301_Tti008441 [Triplophysa tibetana]